MIAFPAGMRVWMAGGVTDMRRRQRFLEPVAQPLATMNTLALQVQQGLGRDPHAGEIFCFRGHKGDLVRLLWHDEVGMSLYTKRLEAGKFIWPTSGSGEAVLTIRAFEAGHRLFLQYQLPMVIEGVTFTDGVAMKDADNRAA